MSPDVEIVASHGRAWIVEQYRLLDVDEDVESVDLLDLVGERP